MTGRHASRVQARGAGGGCGAQVLLLTPTPNPSPLVRPSTIAQEAHHEGEEDFGHAPLFTRRKSVRGFCHSMRKPQGDARLRLGSVCGPRRPARRFDGIFRTLLQHTVRPTLLEHDPSAAGLSQGLANQGAVRQVAHTFPFKGYGHDRSAAAALRSLAYVRRLLDGSAGRIRVRGRAGIDFFADPSW